MKKWHGYILTVAVIGIVIAFWPAFILKFGIHNDYTTTWPVKNSVFFLGHPETQHLFWIGRPLGGLLLNIQFQFFNSISDLSVGRVVSLVFSLATICGAWRITVRYFAVDPFMSGCFWLLIVLMPPFVLNILLLTNFVSGLLNVALVIVSYSVLSNAYMHKSAVQKKVAYSVLAVTFLIYPPTSLFFLVLSAIKLLVASENEYEKRRREVLEEILILVIMCSVYVLLLRWLPDIYMRWFFDVLSEKTLGVYSVELNNSMLDLLKKTIDSLYVGIALWYENPWSALVTGCSFFSCIIMAIRNYLRSPDLFEILYIRQKLLIIIGCLVISLLPILSASGGFVAYRLLLPAMCLLFLIIIYSIYLGYISLITLTRARFFFVVLLSGAIIVTANRVKAVSYNHHQEYRFVEQQLSGVNNFPELVFLVAPPRGSVLSLQYSCFEFGYMATNLAPIWGIISAVLKERGIADNFYGPVVTVHGRGEIPEGVAAPIVDMTTVGFELPKKCTIFGK